MNPGTPPVTAGLVRLNQADMHTAALAYAQAGWPVFPVAGIVSRHCSCRYATDCPNPGKHPLLNNGLHGASTDHSTINRYWRRWPWAGIGIATGQRAGVIVVDIDPQHGGHESLEQLGHRGLHLPNTLTVHTGGGGEHLYYKHPGGRVTNTTGRLPGIVDLPGIDLRGDGGYIIAPPSPHISGGRYQWDITATSVGALPAWAHQRPEPPRSRRPPTLGEGKAARYAKAALDGEVATVRTAPEGQRNMTLYRAAFKLGTLVGTGILDETTVKENLLEAGIVAGLTGRETEASLQSGIKAGIAHPRQVSTLSSASIEPAAAPQATASPAPVPPTLEA